MKPCISGKGHMRALDPRGEATRYARERDDRSAERPRHHGDLRLGVSTNSGEGGGGRDERPSDVAALSAGLYMAGNLVLLASRPPAGVVGSGQGDPITPDIVASRHGRATPQNGVPVQ